MKNYLWALLFLFSAAFTACDDDEVDPGFQNPPVAPNKPALPDTIKPVIKLASPVNDSRLIVIENVIIRVNIKDDTRLKEIRFFLADPGGTRSQFRYLEPFTYFDDKNAKNIDLSVHTHFLMGLATGTYMVIVEAEDTQQNVARESVRIHVSAPDINKSEFIEIFMNNGFIRNYIGDWDYSPLDEVGLSSILLYLLDQDGDERLQKAEWEKFISDFEIKNQDWASWDVNKDGNLTSDEFKNGFIGTKLFLEWDQNKDAVLAEEEFASGVFGRWDTDKNGRLSRKEYEERTYTYLL